MGICQLKLVYTYGTYVKYNYTVPFKCVFRGTTFRDSYNDLGKLRGILTDTPVVILSATMTAAIQEEIEQMLFMSPEETKHIAVLPNR